MTTVIQLPNQRFEPAVDGPPAALYVMVAAHGHAAKIGALEAADNVDSRLRGVEKKQRERGVEDDALPLRTIVGGEIEGLVLGRYQKTDGRWVHDGGQEGFDQRWAEVEHLESAVRIVLARKLGRLSRWTDWIEVDEAVPSDEAWVELFVDAWAQIDQLG